MALTTGEKRNPVTVSSIQSRLGVVDAYSGSGIGEAAKAVSGVLNIEADRRRVQEEEQWKTDFSLATRETISQFSKDHYDDPDAFTKKTDSYIASLVEQSPDRYKAYTKQYAGSLALQKGETIWNESENKRILNLLETNKKESVAFVNSRINEITNTNPADYEQYWLQNLLPELSEKIVSYTNIYNSVPASVQSQMDTPENYERGLYLGFETERIIGKSRLDLEIAASKDREMLLNGEDYEDGLTFVQKEVQKQTLWARKYIESPDSDSNDNQEVFMDTDVTDRTTIIQSVNEFVKGFNNEIIAEQTKLGIRIKTDKQETYNNIVKGFENFVLPDTEAEVNAIISKNNFTVEEAKVIKDQWYTSSAIDDLSNSLVYLDENLAVNYSNLNINIETNKVIESLEYFGIAVNFDEVKQKVVDKQMFNAMKIINPNLLYADYTGLDLNQYFNEEGVQIANPLVDVLVSLSKDFNTVPSVLENYFGQMDTLQAFGGNTVAGSEDYKELIQRAEFARIINNQKTLNPLAFSETTSENFMHLVNLDNALMKIGNPSEEFLSTLTQKQIDELNDKNNIQRNQEIERWYGRVQPDKTLYDEKEKKVYEILDTDGDTVQSIMSDMLTDEEEDAPWWALFFADKGVITEEVEFNLKGKDNQLIPEFNFAMQEIEPIVIRYLLSEFDNPQTITKQQMLKTIRTQKQFIFQALKNLNYGFAE